MIPHGPRPRQPALWETPRPAIWHNPLPPGHLIRQGLPNIVTRVPADRWCPGPTARTITQELPMIATLVIFMREGIEASMIVAILLAYLNRIGQRRYFRDVFIGVGAALALAAGGGVAAYLTIRQYDGSNVQTVFGRQGTYLLAAVVLTYMTFWMRGHARGVLSGELRARARTPRSPAARCTGPAPARLPGRGARGPGDGGLHAGDHLLHLHPGCPARRLDWPGDLAGDRVLHLPAGTQAQPGPVLYDNRRAADVLRRRTGSRTR